MRDRQHRHDDGAVRFALDGQDDDARPVLLSLFPSSLVLVVPEIGIGNHQARLRVGDRHGPLLFGIEHPVEMGVSRIHA